MPYNMAAGTAGVDRNEEITSLSSYVLLPGRHVAWPAASPASVTVATIVSDDCRRSCYGRRVLAHLCRSDTGRNT